MHRLKAVSLLVVAVAAAASAAPSLGALLSDTPGDYAIYLDQRGGANRVTGFMYAGPGKVIVRAVDRQTSTESIMMYTLDFGPQRATLQSVQQLRGSANQDLATRISTDILNLYSQALRVDRITYPAPVDLDDPWPEFGYTLRHTFTFWVPFLQLFRTAPIDKPDVGQYTLAAFGRIRTADDKAFYGFLEAPQSTAGPTASIVVSKPRMEVVGDIGVIVDSHWVAKTDVDSLPKPNRVLWMQGSSARDAELDPVTVDLARFKAADAWAFFKQVLLSSTGYVPPESVVVRQAGANAYLEYDIYFSNVKAYSKEVMIAAPAEGTTSKCVSFVSVRSLFDANRRYFADLLGSVLFTGAAAIAPAVNDALALRDSRNFAQAVTALDTVIQAAPDYAPLYYYRGSALKELRRYDDAITDLSKALALAPNSPAAYADRGTCCVAKLKWDEAAADFGSYIALVPRDPWGYLQRGPTDLARQKYADALADYGRVIELDPGNATAYLGKALAETHSGDLTSAIADLSRSIELNPGSTVAWAQRAAVYLQLEQYDNALADYKKQSELRPDAIDALYYVGLCNDQLKKTDEAVAAYRLFLSKVPKNSTTLASLARKAQDRLAVLAP